MKAYVRGPQLLVRFGMGANRVEKYSEAHSARARLPASAGPCITLPVNDNVSPIEPHQSPISRRSFAIAHSPTSAKLTQRGNLSASCLSSGAHGVDGPLLIGTRARTRIMR